MEEEYSMISYLSIPPVMALLAYEGIAEKEVQDTSCRGSGGVPQIKQVPQDWGSRGLIETISAFSLDWSLGTTVI